MKFRITIVFFLFANALLAQEEELIEYDAYSEDYSYDLVADRLSCIQQDIPLNFNERVYAFINYFIVRNRSYTKFVVNKSTMYFPNNGRTSCKIQSARRAQIPFYR